MKRISNTNIEQYGEKASVFSLQKGKLPPQAVDLEEVVLGAMMIDKKGVDEVIDILQPEAFYKESHQLIFSSIISLFEKQEPIDIKTVSFQLKKDGNWFMPIKLESKNLSSPQVSNFDFLSISAKGEWPNSSIECIWPKLFNNKDDIWRGKKNRFPMFSNNWCFIKSRSEKYKYWKSWKI